MQYFECSGTSAIFYHGMGPAVAKKRGKRALGGEATL